MSSRTDIVFGSFPLRLSKLRTKTTTTALGPHTLIKDADRIGTSYGQFVMFRQKCNIIIVFQIALSTELDSFVDKVKHFCSMKLYMDH